MLYMNESGIGENKIEFNTKIDGMLYWIIRKYTCMLNSTTLCYYLAMMYCKLVFYLLTYYSSDGLFSLVTGGGTLQ